MTEGQIKLSAGCMHTEIAVKQTLNIDFTQITDRPRRCCILGVTGHET